MFEKNPDDFVSFCRSCGTGVFSLVRDGEFYHVALGTLDDPPGVPPSFHIFVASKAQWDEIGDALPRFKEHAPMDFLTG